MGNGAGGVAAEQERQALGESRARFRWRHYTAVGLLLFLALSFSPCLYGLLQLGLKDDLFSHLLLIPVVSCYLVVAERGRPPSPLRTAPLWTVFWLMLGGGCLAYYFFMRPEGAGTGLNDDLFWPSFSLVLFVYAITAGCFGRSVLRTYWFELFFLMFMVPLPSPWIHGISVFLQYASADALEWVLSVTGTPFFRDGVFFYLSGLTLEVAIECSGIRSTLVLFITALLAGRLFLRRAWTKIALVGVVIPLGILRNAVRITTLALLTIHVDAGVIKGPIHTRGGPIFFALSLVVLFALVWLLRFVDRGRRRQA